MMAQSNLPQRLYKSLKFACIIKYEDGEALSVHVTMELMVCLVQRRGGILMEGKGREGDKRK